MFVIPSIALTDLSLDAVARYRAEAATEYNAALAAAREAGTATTEELDRLSALREFVSNADAILSDQPATEPAGEETDDRLGSLAPIEEPTTATVAGEGEGEVDETTVAAIAATRVVSDATARVVEGVVARSAITASAGIDGYTAGQPLDDLGVVAEIISSQVAGMAGVQISGRSRNPVAAIKLPPTTFSATGDRRDLEVMDELVDEKRFGGSLAQARYAAFKDGVAPEALTASAGWCAPSEIDYTVQFNGVSDGLLDVPTMTATRGGVFVMPEIDFSGIYGTAGTGDHFFNLTEAQVIAGNAKAFVEIDCPTPVESRLGVTGFGAISNLLAVRGYPEYTREFVRASLVGLEIFRDSLNLAAMVSGSTANDLSAAKPWSDDASVMSVVLPMAAMAAYDQRARGRFGKNATIEQVFPAWVLEQMRADWMRRNGVDEWNLADADIMAWFAARNIAPQFVLGWQDYYSSGTATMPGTNAAGGIDLFPTTVKFLSYPVGTWVNAVNDVINLSTIYDSARLSVNQRLEVFSERGNIMIKRRSDSRLYTAAICPTGSTGAQRAVACA